MTEVAPTSSNPTHLVVLVHGLWGNPQHLSFLRDTLRKQYSDEGLEILLPSSNSEYNTYDGLDVGGERIAHEIESHLLELKEKGKKIDKISIIGYSLGGLIVRYAIGLLYKAGIFDEIEPINFTTFATPHLGVRTPTQSYKAQTWNFLGSRTLSTSGQQIFLVDNFRESGRGLLEIMADANSIFAKGLSRFKNRSIYANTINDRSVPYYTAAMSRVDEFVDLDAIVPHFVKDDDAKVILDPKNPVTRRKHTEIARASWQNWMLSEPTRRVIPFYIFFLAVVPIAIPLFLVNAGYQTYRSAQRIRLHEKGGSFDLKRYRVPFLEETQAMQDNILRRVTTERTRRKEEYLTEPASKSGPSKPSANGNLTEPSTTTSTSEDDDAPFPTLALTDGQFSMIDGLEAIGFTKYRAHITKARHTHAAIVVRMNRGSFEEGRVVIRHWARHFEV